jgi:hypothetical protein
MSFGINVHYGGGEPDLTIDGRYMRFIVSVRYELGDTGSIQLPFGVTGSQAHWMFSGDDSTKTPPSVSISSSGELSWAPYPYFLDSQGSGTILVAAIA